LLILASQFLFYRSAKCDGIILGFSAKNTPTETLRFTETLLKHLGVKSCGIVLKQEVGWG
jgi:hypothetical protein